MRNAHLGSEALSLLRSSRNGSWDLTNGPEVKTQPSQVRGEVWGHGHGFDP